MGEQPEALQLDPQHLRERDYEAEQAYTDRCPDLPLFTEGSDKQREARQAAKAAERESLLQGLRFLPETASSPQAERARACGRCPGGAFCCAAHGQLCADSRKGRGRKQVPRVRPRRLCASLLLLRSPAATESRAP